MYDVDNRLTCSKNSVMMLSWLEKPCKEKVKLHEEMMLEKESASDAGTVHFTKGIDTCS